MHKLSRTGLDPDAVETAEQLLTDYAPLLGPTDLHRYALQVVEAADPDGPEPIDDQLQHDRRYLELKQRQDGMWWLQGKLTNTVGAQLNAILDPLTRPRSSSIQDHNGNTTALPDPRPCVQRMHDALDEMCGRVLKTADQPVCGGTPASVIVTIGVDDLLAEAGLAETADGSMLTSDQLLRQPLLCRYHHTHFLQKGWNCRINPDRLPEWIPPKWIDRDQRPQLNTRIQRLHTQRRQLRRRRRPAAA